MSSRNGTSQQSIFSELILCFSKLTLYHLFKKIVLFFSAPKQQLLTQHIRVHFCPLPELADWLTENGQAERAQEVNDIDLTQALEVAEKFQSSPKRKLLDLQASEKKSADEGKKNNKVYIFIYVWGIHLSCGGFWPTVIIMRLNEYGVCMIRAVSTERNE